MVSMNYPKYNEHKFSHSNFIENIDKIRSKLCNYENVKAACDEFYNFVLNWILKHYSDDDVRLAAYIKQNS